MVTEDMAMSVNARAFGLATGIVFAISWIICSAFVAIFPGGMMQISGHMIHGNFGGLAWSLTLLGFIAGLIAWSVSSAVIAWAVASVYNRLEA
jgi:hypothetical protein